VRPRDDTSSRASLPCSANARESSIPSPVWSDIGPGRNWQDQVSCSSQASGVPGQCDCGLSAGSTVWACKLPARIIGSMRASRIEGVPRARTLPCSTSRQRLSQARCAAKTGSGRHRCFLSPIGRPESVGYTLGLREASRARALSASKCSRRLDAGGDVAPKCNRRNEWS
jgi:hypothetical protein